MPRGPKGEMGGGGPMSSFLFTAPEPRLLQHFYLLSLSYSLLLSVVSF